LNVGTGFNPEISGREYAYFNRPNNVYPVGLHLSRNLSFPSFSQVVGSCGRTISSVRVFSLEGALFRKK
jgi:hypothetical protein